MKEKPAKKELASFFKRINHLLPEVLKAKTKACKHAHGCVENVVRKMFKNFVIGFMIQFLLKNLLFMAKPAKMLRNL